MSRSLRSLTESRAFQRTVLFVICAAAILVGIETSPSLMAQYGPVLHALDGLILAFFVVEVLARIGAHGRRPWGYFLDGWNVFDFVVVAVCFLPGEAHFAAVLRLARVLRTLRLFTAVPRLQLLVASLLKSLPSMGYVALLLGLLFYVYGVMGVFLWGANDPKHFGDLPSSLLSLFRIVTLEDWTDIMYIQMYGSDAYPAPSVPGVEPRPHASPVLSATYFVSFVLLGTMIVLNLLIGVIINSMTEAQREAERRLRMAAGLGSGDEIEELEHRLEELLDRVRDLRGGMGGKAA